VRSERLEEVGGGWRRSEELREEERSVKGARSEEGRQAW